MLSIVDKLMSNTGHHIILLIYVQLKLFVGNVDRDTKVVNWFKVRLFARYIKIRPNSWNGDICMRIEVIGCHAGMIYLQCFRRFAAEF